MTDTGYIRLYRTLLGHPAFRNDGEAMAFAWMILRASWRPVQVRYKGQRVALERGQLAISVRDLAEKLDRSKGWVERFFKRLKSETMIETCSKTGPNVITICNYNDFQAEQDSGKTPDGTESETDPRQCRDTEQRREKGKNIYSLEAEASNAAKRGEIPRRCKTDHSDQPPAPGGPVQITKAIFDSGVRILGSAGVPDRKARSVIGKWRKDHSDGAVLATLARCETEQPSEPIEWLTKALQAETRKASGKSNGGYGNANRTGANDTDGPSDPFVLAAIAAQAARASAQR